MAKQHSSESQQSGLRLGLVYELTNNPYFDPNLVQFNDRLAEYVAPSEINLLVRTFKELGWEIEVIDGPSELLSRVGQIKENCELVFNKSIGVKGLERKIHVPAICQLFEIPFVGSSAYALTLARHKFHTNRLLNGSGILVPNAILLPPGTPLKPKGMTFPVIVKPNHESDSLGIDDGSVCHDVSGVRDRVTMIWELFGQAAVIEEFVDGEELKVCIIGNAGKSRAAGCVGVLKGGKTMKGTLQTRSDVIQDAFEYYGLENRTIEEQVLRTAESVHDLLQLNDYSRVDLRLTEAGLPIVLEVATHPYLGEGSSFVSAALQSFSDYRCVVGAILHATRSRYTTLWR